MSSVFVPCMCTWVGNGDGRVGNRLLHVAQHDIGIFGRFYTLPVICDDKIIFVYFVRICRA